VRVASIVISLVCIAIPARGIARPKPKIAVAPLAGDSGNKVAEAVVEALAGKDYAVVGPKETGREITRLGLTDELDAKATRKLVSKLGAVAVIDGKVSKTGGKRFLHLEIHRRGKPDNGFTVEFKTTASKGFRRALHDEIGKKLEGASDDPEGDEEAKPSPFADDKRKPADDDAAAERKRKPADDERPARTASDDGDARRPRDDDAERPRTPAPDDDAPRRSRKAEASKPARRVAADDDDDEVAVRKRKRARRDDDAAPQIAARVGAGGAVAQRQLSWDVRGGLTQAQIPPRVLTTAGAGRVDGEIYPLAFSDPHSGLAGLGLAASYDKTFGLAIKVPNQTVSAPINQSHYAIGARYRLGVGEASSVAFGLDYAHRQYIADRSGLGAAVLDTPDFDYAAVSPGAWLRVPVASSVTVFGGADALLIFEAGAIQTSASYGPATVYGLEGAAGVDIALTKQIGLRLALEYSQIMFKFTPKGSTMANNRDGDPSTQDVNGATDRSIGGTAMLCLVY
jgi:opacity protein-like surface antigen